MNKNLEEISDGKRYGLNDMVRGSLQRLCRLFFVL